VRLRISRTFFDSGYRATDVYAWTGPRRFRGIYAIKGMKEERAPLIGKISRTQAARKGAILIPIGGHIGKRTVYDRLDIREPGPGFIHLNQDATDDYLKQLTAEKLVTRYTRERIPVRRWVMKSEGRQNEALDLEVYNLAAFTFLNANMLILSRRLAERIASQIQTTTGRPREQGPTQTTSERKQGEGPRAVRRSSFVGGWRKW
jgi:phage terminase large subunit GpA-like protein